jgi:hypothetical protein
VNPHPGQHIAGRLLGTLAVVAPSRQQKSIGLRARRRIADAIVTLKASLET